MAKRTYDRLSVEDFGRHLLDVNELDPIYVALWRCLKMEDGYSWSQAARWMVAYWCYYNAGVASYMAGFEGDEFWEYMLHAAHNSNLAPSPVARPGHHNGDWPRGHERRHFRGKQAVTGICELIKRYGSRPEDMVTAMTEGDMDYESVARRARQHRGFGPWISFKIADMVDRVLEQRVDFTQAQVFMFTDPVKAALMLWRLRAGVPETAQPRDQQGAITQVVEYLTEHFSGYTAPPAHDRPVGLQEVETILCKWKSHMNGHYPLWNDTDEINASLREWSSVAPLASPFLVNMPGRKNSADEMRPRESHSIGSTA